MIAAQRRRVVITGMGQVSPLGCTVDSLWSGLSEGKSGVTEFDDPSVRLLPLKFVGAAHDFTGHIDNFGPLEKDAKRNIRKALKVMCRDIQMGVAAAQLAISDGQLKPGDYDPERTGIVYGSDYMMTLPDEYSAGIQKCLDEQGEFHFEKWAEEGLPQVAPLWLLKYLPNMPASHIAIYNDMRGPNNSLTLREASGNVAVAEAFTTIVRGSAERIVTGSTGTRIQPARLVHMLLQEQVAQGDTPPQRASRPFDKDRRGMVLGEGAAALLLEDLASAEERGVTIYGEVVGYGASTVTNRRGVGDCRKALANVMREALRRADMSPEEVGHLHAHGLSTTRMDVAEAQAIDDVFGRRGDPIPVTAAKSYFGNLGAGSGLVELIGSILAMQRGPLFPVLNHETPDPECPLNIVRSGKEAPAGRSVLSVNVTPQGQAGAVLVKAWEG